MLCLDNEMISAFPYKRLLPLLVTAVAVCASPLTKADSDLDLYIASEAWERADSRFEPEWIRRPEWDLPQLGIYQGAIFDDLDDDGDLDAYVTHDSNPLLGYENIGSGAGPIWKRQPSWDFTVAGIQENKVYATAFVDLDGDGRMDLTVAKHDTIRAYRNVGGPLPARWQRASDWDVPLSGTFNLMHTFVDLDGDDDQDLLVRTWWSGAFAFENIGTIGRPIWRERAEWALPEADLFSPTADDLDNDGDYDIGDAVPGHTLVLLENIGDASQPIWKQNDAWESPSPAPSYWAGHATFVNIDAATKVTKIGVEAHIDGRDQLIIKDDTLKWHHISAAAVGRHSGANSPTIISNSDGHNVTEWLPSWPTRPPDELRVAADSSLFVGLPEPIPRDGMQWRLVKNFGRDVARIIEQPNKSNDYTLVVEFNDPSPGSRYYGIELIKAVGTGGDFDRDGDVDRDDILLLLKRRNTLASGPDDRMDLDQDGNITVLDARILVNTCTIRGCMAE